MIRSLQTYLVILLAAIAVPAIADVRDTLGAWTLENVRSGSEDAQPFSEGVISLSASGDNYYVIIELGDWWSVDKVFAPVEETGIYAESTGWLSRLTAGDTPVAEVLKRGDPAIWMRDIPGGIAVYEARILESGMFDMKFLEFTMSDAGPRVTVKYSTGIEDTVVTNAEALAK